MIHLVISGCNGRMGQVVADLCKQEEEIQIVAGIDLHPEKRSDFPVYADPMEYVGPADVVIDFSAPQALDGLLDFCRSRSAGIVLATTGYSETQLMAIEAAAKQIPIFKSANMSLGINVLLELVRSAAKVLGGSYDVEIEERHHNQKVDAPSGTALMLADAINEENNGAYHYVYDRSSVRQKRDPKEIGISSVRGGSIVGDHEVLFCGPDEVITLRHTAYSRSIFANGAVNAAVYLAKKEPGLYDMGDLIAAL